MLCCVHVQSGRTALCWAAYRGDVNIVQMLIDHGAAMDLGKDVYVLISHDYLLTCGWSFGGYILVYDEHSIRQYTRSYSL
jgi:ankyrin repeat protein